MTGLLEPAVRTLPVLDEEAHAALFTDARTANTLAPTPVTDAELASIWELARWAPTAANTQPLRVLYVQSDEARARLVGHMNEGNRAKTAAAPAVAVLAADSRFHEFVPQLLPHKPEMKDVLAANESLRSGMAQFNAALQAGYFLLAVRAHGLAAGPMGGFDAAAVDAEFFPDQRWRSVLVVNIGHPGVDAWRDRVPRLDHTDVLSWA